MNFVQLILESIESLNSNKVRSSLTMLGIIIGVASVIAMMAIGAGAQNSITSQINSIGTNLLYLNSGGTSANPLPLTLRDAQVIANPQFAPSVGKVAPTIRAQSQVSVPGISQNTSVSGVTPEFFEVQKADLSEGQSITQANVDERASVALLGSTTAQNLFNRTDNLVGKTVRIRGQIFTISGILKAQGGTGFGNSDDRVLIPLTTAQLRIVHRSIPDQVDMIYIQAIDIQHNARMIRSRPVADI